MKPSIFIVLFTLTLFISFTSSSARNLNLLKTRRERRGVCPAVEKCLKRLDAGAECDVLPIPDRARFPVVTTFTIKKLRQGVWAFIDTSYITLILLRGSRLALVDFPEASNDRGLPFVTDAVLQILKDKKPTKIDMVYSHSHFDHIGGATRFFNWAKERYPDAKINVWGTRDAARVIKQSRTQRAILPDIIVTKGAVLPMGGGLNVKMAVIGGHTGEDLLLYIPRAGKNAGIVMLVDVVFPRWGPFFNIALTDDVTRYKEVQELILKLRFDVYVGGHLRLGSKRDVKDNLQFTKDLMQAADDAFEVSAEELGNTEFGNVFDPSTNVYGNLWFGVQERMEVQEAKCIRSMIEKWGCRIGGLDIVIKSHCFTALEHRLLEV